MIDVVPLRYGTPFKKAFSDPEVFSAFVQDVVGIELEFTHIEQEKAFPAPVGNIDIHFDLFGEDIKHRAIVELQHVRESDAFARFHYYHLVAQIEQVTSSKNYEVQRTVYTIVILTRLPEDKHLRFDIASQSSDIVTHDGRALGLFNHRIVFINPRGLSANTPANLGRWLALFEDSLDGNIDEKAFPEPLFQRVIHSIETSRLSPQERYWMKEESIWEDTKTTSYKEGLDKGRKEGLDEGRKEGLDEGRKEGLDEGRKEGLDEGRKEGLDEGHDKGLKEGLRKAVFDLCDVLDIAIDEPRTTYLETLDAETLDALRTQIKRTKRWPE